VIENPVKKRLASGGLALGVGIRQARTVDIATAMKTAGFDFLFIDLEHGALSVDLAGQISVAACAAGIAPIVRVPGFAHHHASRALDSGALGVVFPHVDDAETAARLAGFCRYPPAGTRSFAAAQPQLAFRALPMGEVTAALDDAVQVVAMIETGKAVENAAAIASVPGVDVLLVGTNDLCLDLGVGGALDHPEIVRSLERVVAGCREHGKTAGLGGVYEPGLMRRYVEMGFRWITTGSDLLFMMREATRQAATVREMLSA
jgi:2-keto-3-deoxy-L-rhamnonate aldolase RhmA